MKRFFVPDYIFEKFNSVGAEFFLLRGIKGLILDVDNTLEPYENPTPGDHVKKWIRDLQDAGIACAIVSNNNRSRIDTFNRELGLLAYSRGKKPFSKYVKRALSEIGVAPCEAAMMGDQIFTDVWCARNSGLVAILVPPIKDKKGLLTRAKRILEKPIIKKYYRLQVKKTEI